MLFSIYKIMRNLSFTIFSITIRLYMTVCFWVHGWLSFDEIKVECNQWCMTEERMLFNFLQKNSVIPFPDLPQLSANKADINPYPRCVNFQANSSHRPLSILPETSYNFDFEVVNSCIMLPFYLIRDWQRNPEIQKLNEGLISSCNTSFCQSS